MIQPRVLPLAIIVATLSVAGCNSNDDDGAGRSSTTTNTPTPVMTTITVTPSLGQIRNAKVVLRNAKTNQIIVPAKVLNDTTGTAQFSVPVDKLAEPIIAAVLPNDTGDVKYFDESTNQLTTIAINSSNRDTPILRAAAKVTPNANIGVTALTEAAVQTAEVKAGGLAFNIDSVNALIKAELKLAFSILQAPLVIGATTQYSNLSNTALVESQRAYAAYLANLAKQAAMLNPSSTQPALDIVKTLSADFKDDSHLNASFNAQQFIIAYNAAFAAAWAEVANKLQAALKNLPANTTNLDNFFHTVSQATPVATPVRVVGGVAEYACADESKLLSSSGSQSIYIDFVNHSDSDLNIFWLNYSGQRVSYKQGLGFFGTHSQQTFVTHPWVVTDSAGVCKGIYRPVTQSNKTLTFNSDGSVNIEGIGGRSPGTVATGLQGSYNLVYQRLDLKATTPYTNGQQVTAIVGADNSLTINGKKLVNPYIQSVFPPELYWQDGALSYGLSNNQTGAFTVLRLVDSNSALFALGAFTKVITGNPATCAGLDLQTGNLADLSDFVGSYNATINNTAATFSLDVAGTATLNGQTAAFKEVCAPKAQGNGTNVVLITQKANVTLFKDNNNVITAEGKDFTNPTANNSYFGTKQVVNPGTGTCVGNTNQFGCLTITGANAPASIYEFKGAGVPLFQSAVTNTGAVTFFGEVLSATNHIINGMGVGFQQISGSTQQTNYSFFQYNDTNTALLTSLTFQCKDANGDCQGLTVNQAAKTVTYNNVVMTQINPATGAQLTFNGVLKY